MFNSDEYPQKEVFLYRKGSILYLGPLTEGGMGASENLLMITLVLSPQTPIYSHFSSVSIILYIFKFPQFISFLPTRSHFIPFSFPLTNKVYSRTATIFSPRCLYTGTVTYQNTF